MEIIRAAAVTKLRELGKISNPIISARELRFQRKPMLKRVQMIEQRKYHKTIETQKKKLNKDIQNIDVYSKSVKDYEDYLARKAAYEALQPVSQVSLFTESAPAVLSKPSVIIKSMPFLRETKLKRYKGRRFR